MKKTSILLLAILMIIPSAFAIRKKNHTVTNKNKISSPGAHISEKNFALFSELHLGEAGMKPGVFDAALKGLEKLEEKNALERSDIITIIDYSQPSDQKRLYVLDLTNKQILFNTLVAHGKNSGKRWATSFSNKTTSLKSSPGFYITGEEYMGDNGYSLRLDGIEKNINDNARKRNVVLHGAAYVDESLINATGFLGRSWGCPAVPLADHEAIINTIKGGTCLFIYSPGRNYLPKSFLLNS